MQDALAALLVDRDTTRLQWALTTVDAESPYADALQGELARRRGDPGQAAPLLQHALDALPEVGPLNHAAALAHAANGDRAQARAIWEAWLARAPEDASARFQIAVTHHDDGELEAAMRWYERQAEKFPGHAATWLNLGLVRRALDDLSGALTAWARMRTLAPGDPRPLTLAAEVQGELARLPEAIELLSRAIALVPSEARPRFARAAHHSSLALHAQAISDLREAVRLDPDNAAGESALLLELHYDAAAASAEALAAAHRDWARRHAQAPPMRQARRAQGARLRIGYLSPRFDDVPLLALLLPVLEAHDRARFEVFCYAAQPMRVPDGASVPRAAEQWRELPFDDAAAAEVIAADRLDLLIDLAGHAPGNRLRMLARKPAPRQATWLDYFDTTGVEAIEFLISDARHTPSDKAPRFSERLVLLPEVRFVYRPPVAITPSAAPALDRGVVTFGSFNRHAKHTDDVASTWATVLRAVPESRLVLRGSAYRAQSTIEFVRARWKAQGVPVERIEFHPFVSLEAVHAAYATIDIALDPFPFNGGVTTCDALAHGVPVVTLAGDGMVARQGAALLAATRRPQWIATTRDDYVRVALALASPASLRDTRAALATDFARSPLTDVAVFARSFERAIVAMIEADLRDRRPLCIASG